MAVRRHCTEHVTWLLQALGRPRRLRAGPGPASLLQAQRPCLQNGDSAIHRDKSPWEACSAGSTETCSLVLTRPPWLLSSASAPPRTWAAMVISVHRCKIQPTAPRTPSPGPSEATSLVCTGGATPGMLGITPLWGKGPALSQPPQSTPRDASLHLGLPGSSRACSVWGWGGLRPSQGLAGAKQGPG